MLLLQGNMSFFLFQKKCKLLPVTQIFREIQIPNFLGEFRKQNTLSLRNHYPQLHLGSSHRAAIEPPSSSR